MPMYEFKCEKCQRITEKLCKISDDVESIPCQKFDFDDNQVLCGGKAKKIVSSSSFVLKGTGWYETDFK